MHPDDRELDDILRVLAAVIRARREQLGISQEELAHRAGLHRTYISDIERGSRNIAVKNLVRLAHALGVPVSYFFTADVFQERSIDNHSDPRE